MSVENNLKNILRELPPEVELVVVSKFRPAEELARAYDAGQRVFGESRPQEMAAKRSLLPPDVRWHQIGHLQTNKVRLIAPFVELIHSVDSPHLLGEIDRRAKDNSRRIDVLLEIRVAAEDAKHGWEFAKLTGWLATGEWRSLTATRFRGVMGMATNTSDTVRVRQDFRRLKTMFDELRAKFFDDNFDTLSMGMSGDYPIAIEEGATMVRIGGAIFQ